MIWVTYEKIAADKLKEKMKLTKSKNNHYLLVELNGSECDFLRYKLF
jgi:hypothetical protein